MPAINQDFSVPAGDEATVTIDIGPDVAPGLTGQDVIFRAFALANGVPDRTAALIEKSVSGGGVVVTSEPSQTAAISFDRADTLALLGNYFHEVSIQDVSDNYITVASGVMTVGPVEGVLVPDVEDDTARTALTAQDLKRRYPAFAGVADAQVEFALEDAARWVDAGGWLAADVNAGRLALAAHFLFADGALSDAALSSQAVVGPVTSERLGDAAVTYGAKGGSAQAGGMTADLQTSAYGQRFLELARANRRGPRVTGQP
jgi:hypothetical protein